MCKKHGLESSDNWYEHTPTDVMENDEVELYWDLTIQTDMTVTHNRPYYPSWKGKTVMDNHWYCCSRWLKCSQNRGLESWEISGSSIWGKEIPSCRDSHSTSCDWSSMNSTKVTHQVNWAFRHWWHHSLHANVSTVRNSRNTMQGNESLNYKS